MIEWGNTIHRGDKAFGGFLLCINPKCPTTENVKGHGNGRSESSILSNAYKIIMAKYTGAKIDLSEERNAEPTVEQVEAVETVVKAPVKRGRKPKTELPVVEIEAEEPEDADDLFSVL